MTRDMSDVTWAEIWKFELSLAIRRRRVNFACSSRPCGGCHTYCMGVDGKASIERLCLSLYVEKPFNSKVIKSFIPELRSRKCFSCFGIPMFYLYMLWTFYVRFTYPYSSMAMLQVFHVLGSIEKCHLWVFPCFSSSVTCVLFVLVGSFLTR